jgi:hypothetical protein
MSDWRPISPPVETGARGDALPAYVSNGLFGLRVRENPLIAGMCIVSGFVGEHHEKRIKRRWRGPIRWEATALNGLWAGDQPRADGAIASHDDYRSSEPCGPAPRLGSDRMRPARGAGPGRAPRRAAGRQAGAAGVRLTS